MKVHALVQKDEGPKRNPILQVQLQDEGGEQVPGKQLDGNPMKDNASLPETVYVEQMKDNAFDEDLVQLPGKLDENQMKDNASSKDDVRVRVRVIVRRTRYQPVNLPGLEKFFFWPTLLCFYINISTLVVCILVQLRFL
jgi:hypothetical protein